MRGPGIAIHTAVLASAIGVDAGLETNVRAFIVRDNGAGGIAQELCGRGWIPLVSIPNLVGGSRSIRIGLLANRLEAIRRVVCRPAPANGHSANHKEAKFRGECQQCGSVLYVHREIEFTVCHFSVPRTVTE